MYRATKVEEKKWSKLCHEFYTCIDVYTFGDMDLARITIALIYFIYYLRENAPIRNKLIIIMGKKYKTSNFVCSHHL